MALCVFNCKTITDNNNAVAHIMSIIVCFSDYARRDWIVGRTTNIPALIQRFVFASMYAVCVRHGQMPLFLVVVLSHVTASTYKPYVCTTATR